MNNPDLELHLEKIKKLTSLVKQTADAVDRTSTIKDDERTSQQIQDAIKRYENA